LYSELGTIVSSGSVASAMFIVYNCSTFPAVFSIISFISYFPALSDENLRLFSFDISSSPIYQVEL
jgi:hypothetical protein